MVLHAANSWDSVKFADQHLAEALSRLVPVLYVDPPISLLTPLRRPAARAALRSPRLRLLAPGLARLTPLAPPGMERPGMAALTTRLVRRAMGAAARELVGPRGRVRALVACSVLVRTLGACGEELKVYWAQDDFVGGAELFGTSAGRIRRGEARLAAAAEVIVASSPTVAEAWRSRGREPVLIPFGCDAAGFAGTDRASLPADAAMPGPVAGFVGHLGERIDLRLLEAVAETGCSLLLVGPRHPRFQLERMGRLLARPNVRWVGARPFEALPGYLRAIDVGLVPYADSEFNRGSFPLKTLEYLAAGRGVVATDLPAIRWLGTGLIRVAAEPAAFAREVTQALGEPRTAELAARRRAFAAEHGWDRRAEAFARALGVPAAQPSASPPAWP
ncbi:MAG TPA: glycosyltransferase [Actinomycetes bacterium]|nr:glycosyltransferase [Actinomycetes bacterium]